MKLCIPVETNEGKASNVYSHFGSAPCFLIYDIETDSIEAIDNTNKEHVHGMCNPLQAVAGARIDAVVCGGMGVRALMKVMEKGLKAYLASGQTVEAIVQQYKAGQLQEMTLDSACRDHHCH